MKLTIKKDNLLTGLARVIDSAQTKVTMPVLCSVLLDADTGLAISATNLDIYAKTTVPANIKESGKVAINAKRLLDIAKLAPSEEISIVASKGSRVAIKSGGAVFNFSGMESSEFPVLPKYEESNRVEASATAFLNMLNSVAFCQGTSPERYVIMGIHVALRDGELVTEATDGARLARNAKKLDSESSFDATIPSFTVSVITKLLKDAATVAIMVSESCVAIRITHAEDGGETLVISKLVSGTFPIVARVIPKSVNGTIKANREQLLGMVGRVAIACSDKVTFVKMNVAKNEITISAASPENGEASESMTVEYDSIPMQIGISKRYLAEALTNISGEEIKIGIIDAASPCTFSNDDAGYTSIAMPVRNS